MEDSVDDKSNMYDEDAATKVRVNGTERLTMLASRFCTSARCYSTVFVIALDAGGFVYREVRVLRLAYEAALCE